VEPRAVGRFAPSTTGEAHPGTLLSALLAWLDARSRGGRALLRLEDLDHERCKPAWADHMRRALDWLGLDWDDIVVQSGRGRAHEAALDRLAAAGRLYPCTCSRADRVGGRRAPDGGWAYANTCRARALPPGGWRAVAGNVRLRLDDDRVELVDEGGLDLGQTPAAEMGDPIVRRRDGVVAYQLVVVVDDADAGVNRIVRGRDIAPSTATQVVIHRLLGLPLPVYRHHALLLEARDTGVPGDGEAGALGVDKLAKLHGSIPFSRVQPRYRPEELCGWLACACGLAAQPRAIAPRELLTEFSWSRVDGRDRVVRWDEVAGLVIDPL
jgi:glutamyl/glutaminyl-tRNA synthetase